LETLLYQDMRDSVINHLILKTMYMARPEDVILQEIDKVLDDYVDRVFEISQQNLIDQNKVDTSNLLRTGNIIRNKLNKVIVYPAPYADIPEFGRTAGTPVYSPWLHGWVKRKLGISDPKKIRSVAWAISKSIEKRGIEATPYLRPAIERANKEFGF